MNLNRLLKSIRVEKLGQYENQVTRKRKRYVQQLSLNELEFDNVPKKKIEIEANFNLSILREPLVLVKRSNGIEGFEEFLDWKTFYKFPATQLFPINFISNNSLLAAQIRQKLGCEHVKDYSLMERYDWTSFECLIHARKQDWQAAIYSAYGQLLVNHIERFYIMPSPDLNPEAKATVLFSRAHSVFLTQNHHCQLNDLCCVIIGATSKFIDRLTSYGVKLKQFSELSHHTTSISGHSSTKNSSMAGKTERKATEQNFIAFGKCSMSAIIDAFTEIVLPFHDHVKLHLDLPYILSDQTFANATCVPVTILTSQISGDASKLTGVSAPRDSELRSEATKENTIYNLQRSPIIPPEKRKMIQSKIQPNKKGSAFMQKSKAQLDGFFTASSLQSLCTFLSRYAKWLELKHDDHCDKPNAIETALQPEDLQPPPDTTVAPPLRPPPRESMPPPSSSLSTLNRNSSFAATSAWIGNSSLLKNPIQIVTSVTRTDDGDVDTEGEPENALSQEGSSPGKDDGDRGTTVGLWFRLRCTSADNMEPLRMLETRAHRHHQSSQEPSKANAPRSPRVSRRSAGAALDGMAEEVTGDGTGPAEDGYDYGYTHIIREVYWQHASSLTHKEFLVDNDVNAAIAGGATLDEREVYLVTVCAQEPSALEANESNGAVT